MVSRLLSVCPSVFSFPDDNLRTYYWIFNKLGVCIDIVDMWFGIVNGQILSNFDRIIRPCVRPLCRFFPNIL